MFKCKICNKEYPLLLSLSKHLTNKHKYDGGLIQYYVNYEKFEIPKCLYCDNDAKHQEGLKFRKTCSKKECVKKISSRPQTDESKIKISKKLIESHKNGEHPGWSFINKDINRRSYPEKWFVKNVLEKFDFYSKYTIKEKMPFGKYFLDFAIINIKLDLEIDGQQHFITTNAIKHDLERDKFLIDNDWKVYRIAWIELLNNPKKIVDDFLIWLYKNEKYRKYNIDEIIKTQKYENSNAYFSERKKQYELNQIKNIEKIMNSDIDFSKKGWSKEVSKLIDIKKVVWWMKRNMKNFYEINCWKKSAL